MRSLRVDGRALLWRVTLLTLVALAGCTGESVVGGRLDATTPLDLPVAPPDALPDALPDAAPDVPAPCRADTDCAGATPVCDLPSGRCVACTAASDRCDPAAHCDPATYACVPGCRSDDGCAAPAPDGGVAPRRCDVAAHRCVECVADAHCPPGNVCTGNVCVTGCNAAQPCLAWNGRDHVLAWSDQPDAAPNVRVVRFDRDGVARGERLVMEGAPGREARRLGERGVERGDVHLQRRRALGSAPGEGPPVVVRHDPRELDGRLGVDQPPPEARAVAVGQRVERHVVVDRGGRQPRRARGLRVGGDHEGGRRRDATRGRDAGQEEQREREREALGRGLLEEPDGSLAQVECRQRIGQAAPDQELHRKVADPARLAGTLAHRIFDPAL